MCRRTSPSPSNPFVPLDLINVVVLWYMLDALAKVPLTMTDLEASPENGFWNADCDSCS
jgi:hypothetical protein